MSVHSNQIHQKISQARFSAFFFSFWYNKSCLSVTALKVYGHNKKRYHLILNVKRWWWFANKWKFIAAVMVPLIFDLKPESIFRPKKARNTYNKCDNSNTNKRHQFRQKWFENFAKCTLSIDMIRHTFWDWYWSQKKRENHLKWWKSGHAILIFELYLYSMPWSANVVLSHEKQQNWRKSSNGELLYFFHTITIAT